MLETLRVQNYALIDTVEIEFQHGFNVLTGETGAGKSILVGALNLVLGSRASSDAVREGAQKATVDAVFRIGKPTARLRRILEHNEIELEDGALILSRVVSADGRSKSYAGGSIVPLTVLSEIGDELVDMHGQHEHQSLLKADRQLELLDAFAALEDDVAALSAQVRAMRELERSIETLEADDRDRARQIEFLKFEVSEIDGANLRPGEEEELRSRRTLITNAEKIVSAAAEAFGALYDNESGSAAEGLDIAVRAIEDLAAIDERFGPLLRQLHEIRENISAAADEVRSFTEAQEFDPEELNELNQRITLIRDLKRKYGDSIEAILAYKDDAQSKVDAYEQRDERLAALRSEVARARKAAEETATAVSKARKSAAQKLDGRVTRALQDLGMKGAVFETRCEQIALTQSGVDRVEFMLAANKGERAKPLRHVASGGEISRIMLGLKATFAKADAIPTLIFDEIDAGVGGAVANQVARKMGDLSKSHQTICITHLPQIAAAADAHFSVVKAAKKNRTTTQVVRIEHDHRVEELARLLDGSLTEVSLEHARALLNAS